MRLFEERRDTEAGQKVGRRGERKREGRVRERERDRERTRNGWKRRRKLRHAIADKGLCDYSAITGGL